MNEELWKRLPTPPGEWVGRRTRACVRVCLGFRAAWVLGAAAWPPRRGPGAHVARPPRALARPSRLERPADTLKAGARLPAAGGWTSAPRVGRFEKQAARLGLRLAPGGRGAFSSSRRTLGELMARSLGNEVVFSGSPRTPREGIWRAVSEIEQGAPVLGSLGVPPAPLSLSVAVAMRTATQRRSRKPP